MKIIPKEPSKRAQFTDFIWFFARRNIWKQIGFLLLYYASIIGILSVLRSYLVDLGYSMKEIGIMIGIGGTGAAFASSFLAGLLVRKIGRYHSRILFAIFILLTTFYVYFMDSPFIFNALFRNRPAMECLWNGNYCSVYHFYGLCTQRM